MLGAYILAGWLVMISAGEVSWKPWWLVVMDSFFLNVHILIFLRARSFEGGEESVYGVHTLGRRVLAFQD